MSLFDFLGGSESKKVERLAGKALQKYGPPENRQKALEQLVDLGTPEALSVLLKRFTVTVDPGITDREEKDYLYKSVLDFGDDAVGPLKEFVRHSETAIAWALKALMALVPPPELAELCIHVIEKLGPVYTRDPEKKVVLLNQLQEMDDARIAPAVVPFLGDPADDVKIAAAKILAKTRTEPVRTALLDALIAEGEHKRVAAALIEALAAGGFGVQGYREKVTALLQEPYFIDKEGTVKKRG